MHKIPLYEDARRKIVQLWKAKHSLSLAAQARFPKSYPVSKAIFKICHCDPTCTIRFIADKSACHCADRYGDDIFRREVDGEKLPDVTRWFYGFCHHISNEEVSLNRTKTFGAVEIQMLEAVHRCAECFIHSVSQLPYINAKELAREVKRFEQCFAKAQQQVENVSPFYVAYRCLHYALPLASSTKSSLSAANNVSPSSIDIVPSFRISRVWSIQERA